MLRIERCLIDANWGSSTDVVYQFCRQSAHAGIVMPSHGRFVGASSQPFSEYKRRPGDRVGHNWRIPNVHGKRAVRHVVFDTNYWKSFVHARLAVAMGDRGCLSLFGDKPDQHRLLAEHLTGEYRVKTEGRGRTVDEWKLRPERADNHWLDCLVGCAVAASMQGCALPGAEGVVVSATRAGELFGVAAEAASMNRTHPAQQRTRHRVPPVRLPALLHDPYRTAPRRPHSPPQGVPPLWSQNRDLRVSCAAHRDFRLLQVAGLPEIIANRAKHSLDGIGNQGTVRPARGSELFAGWPLGRTTAPLSSPSMADDLDDTIRENASGPAKAAGDAGSVEQHKLTDQIEADRYLASKQAAQVEVARTRVQQARSPRSRLTC